MSAGPQLICSPCHSNSPRQNRAAKSDQKNQIPRSEKIGWFHQSENGFIVHPSKAALPEPPIRSPKFARIHIVQTTIGVIAVRQRAPIGIAARAQRPRGFHRVFSKTAAKMITTSGALLTLVRYPAA